MAEIVFQSDSAAATVALGRALGPLLEAGDVVALVGELGAGKTQMVRGIAEGVGADPGAVSSPTFVLMAEHTIPPQGAGRIDAPEALVHVDAYRITSLADLESAGFTGELFHGAVTLIEWADRIADDLPADHLRVELEHVGGEHRRIALTAAGRWEDRASLVRRIVADLATPATCPTCGGEAKKWNDDFPFCSKRCRMADLNRWFREDYKLSRPIEADEELSD